MEKEYKYKATGLIAKAFDEAKIKFRVETFLDNEEIQAKFGVDCGPNVAVSFISRDNDNDVAMRVFSLISNIPLEKRTRVIEACNSLNEKVRTIKFVIDTDNNVNVEYDFPQKLSDDCLGDVAIEMFVRTMHILDNEYSMFVKALFTEDDLEKENRIAKAELLMKILESIDEEDLQDDTDNDEYDCEVDEINYDE